MIFHFLLGFLPLGYIGWNCPSEGIQSPVSFYFRYYPYSILTNNSFPLYIFIGISAFLPAYLYFQQHKEYSLKTQTVKRYFRLMPMTLAGCVMSVILYRTGLSPFARFGASLGNNWIAVMDTLCAYTLSDALQDGLFTAYLKGTQYVSSLWCVNMFFLGTLLTSFILLVFGKAKRRPVIYALIAVFLYQTPGYLSFLACIVSADILAHRHESSRKWPYAVLLLLGIVCGLFPPVLLPQYINITVMYAIGTFGVITGSAVLFEKNAILNARIPRLLGEKSFAFIITHMLVLMSVNAHLYLYLEKTGMPFFCNFITNLVVFLLVSLIAGWGFDKLLTPLTNRLCRAAEVFFFEKDTQPLP